MYRAIKPPLAHALICGVEDESIFDMLVIFAKAYALRMTMREIWDLPREEDFQYTKADWLQLLLD